MKDTMLTRKRRREAGIALLIAIFVLLLIGVVAIAMVVSSGTESALTGNYRSSTGVYYAALAGVEEARARLRPNDPNSFKNTWAAFYPAGGATLPIGTVGYVLNPSPTDNAGAMLTTYPDTEYDNEFGPGALGAANVQTTQSVWNINPLSGLPFAGPLYKWVRINAISEKSLNLDVDADGQPDSIAPLYYDTSTSPSSFNNTGTGSQALELTALAVLPNGSQKLLQYLVAPLPLSLNFNAALTLDGNNVQFTAPNTNNFWVKGNDQYSVGSCNPGAGVVTALGYTNNADSSQANILSAIQTSPPAAPGQDRRGNYTNGAAPTPNVALVAVAPNLQTVAGLNSLVQTITQNADLVINGPVTQSDANNLMPSGMSATNPMTMVVNGDFTINSWHGQGYGLLLVTGQLRYDPDASWNGIVLVIGLGKMTSNQNGNGQFNGAVFLASTNPAVPPMFDFNPTSGSYGVYYSSCWIQAATPRTPYKILSFHEVSQ